jgi:hypothetical protein
MRFRGDRVVQLILAVFGACREARVSSPRIALASVAGALTLVAAAPSGLAADDPGQSAPVAGIAPQNGAGAKQGAELESLRTRTSRTFVGADGANETRLYAEPVNYRAGGKWEPIDNGLRPDPAPGYALENGANSYDLKLPDRLGDGPVSISSGSASLDVGLNGADAAPVAHGPAAT